jgi:hypothetical protein
MQKISSKVIYQNEVLGFENFYVVEFALTGWLGDHERKASVFFIGENCIYVYILLKYNSK